MKRIRVIVLTAFSALLPLLGLNAAPTFTIQGGTLTAVELHGDSKIILPDGVTGILDYAFRGCTSLTSLIIPASVTGIGGAAFYGCCNLSHITFIGDKLFLGSENLGYIAQNCVIESNGHYNGTYYDSSSNVGWTINDGWLTGVELNGETNVTIPSIVTYINGSAFHYCGGLKRVTIPASVMGIVNAAFDGCRGLTNITVDVDNANYMSVDGLLLSKDGATLILCANKSECISIPDGVKIIGNKAFENCHRLKNVLIPDGVVSIGGLAFHGCSSLMRVTIPDSVTNIGNQAFRGCSRLADANGFVVVRSVLYDYYGDNSDITIADSVTKIGANAFDNGGSLTSVTMPNSVTSIGSSAFYNCGSLTNVTISESVTSIGDSAFNNCGKLALALLPMQLSGSVSRNNQFKNCASNFKMVFYEGSLEEVEWVAVGFDANGGAVSTAPMDIIKGQSLKTIGVTNAIVPQYVYDVGLRSFFPNACAKNITNLVIADGVTSIVAQLGLSGCDGVTSLTIPNSVTNIGRWALYCGNLTLALVPSRLKDIVSQNNPFFYSDTQIVYYDDSDWVDVTFDANGGYVAPSVANALKGHVSGYGIGNFPSASRPGYDFKGWYTDAEHGEQVTAETIVEGNLTLYAHWEKQPVFLWVYAMID